MTKTGQNIEVSVPSPSTFLAWELSPALSGGKPTGVVPHRGQLISRNTLLAPTIPHIRAASRKINDLGEEIIDVSFKYNLKFGS